MITVRALAATRLGEPTAGSCLLSVFAPSGSHVPSGTVLTILRKDGDNVEVQMQGDAGVRGWSKKWNLQAQDASPAKGKGKGKDDEEPPEQEACMIA